MLQTWQKLSPIEKLMAAECNSNNPVIITGCMSLAKSVDNQWLNDIFLPRLLQNPRFSSRLVGSSYTNFHYHPVPDFSINSDFLQQHHVSIEPIIDPSKSWQQRERIFTNRLSDIISTPLDFSRPLWKIFLFPGWSLNPGQDGDTSQSSMIVFRVHHCVGDGIGLIKFLTSQLTDSTNQEQKSLLVVPNRQRVQKRNGNNQLTSSPSTRFLPLILRLPFSIIGKILDLFEDLYNSSIRMLIYEPKSTFTISPIQREKVCALLPPSKISVSEIKTAARLLDATLNDILFTAISSTTCRYLQDSGDNMSNLDDLRIGIPFNRHSLQTFDPQDVSNKFTVVSMPLHLTEYDLASRLKACKKTLRRMKRSFQPAMLLGFVAAIAALPHRIGRSCWRRFTRVASLLFTNVPGPQQPVKIGNIDVTAMHFFAPTDGHIGVVISLFSYAGRIAVGVSGDKGRISDPKRFVDILLEEIHALIDLAQNKKIIS